MRNLIANMHRLRARLGAKWCVVALLAPPTAFGVLHFGLQAALVVSLSVVFCMAAAVVPRLLCGKSFTLMHPGSIITGLLLGLTLSTNTPVYMIVVGALVAQLPGKWKLGWLGRNPLNPAALGRTAVAVLEYVDFSAQGAWDQVDVATGASALFKEAGGNLRPAMSDLFVGLHAGAIGETSELVLIPSGILMLWFVVIKRHAALAMIATVPLLILCLPESPDVVGHAPWMYDPFVYLLGGNTLLLAIFFATDPMTIPRTRLGGILFGVGMAVLGVLGRFYTTIPGVEMYAVLVMNCFVFVLDGSWISSLQRRGKVQPANTSHVNGTPRNRSNAVASFFEQTSEDSPDGEVPSAGRLRRITSPQNRKRFSEFQKLIAAGNRDAVLDIVHMTNTKSRFARRFSLSEKHVIAGNRRGVLDTVEKSGLLGCGGARFPVHRKWKAVLEHNGPRVLIANGQEGEPETFKDRFLMEHHARLVVEGIAIAAFVIEAKEVHAVVTARSTDALEAMTNAVADFEQLEQSRTIPPIKIVEGPDLYICGEETALIESLESHRGEPRLRPPLPVQSGLYGRPTLVQNVETLSWLPSILHHGPDWFRGPKGSGCQLVSLSGAVAHPGVYEVETGTSLIDILSMGGGMSRGEQLQAFAVGGPSGGFLPLSQSRLPFEPAALKKAGTMMGTGAIRILGASDCVVDEALKAATFFQNESCGRCTPCRVGTSEVVRLWRKLAEGEGNTIDIDQIHEIAVTMRQTSTCGLGSAAACRILSVIEAWPEQLQTSSTASNTERSY